jgi:hypothetical protein
MDSSLCGCPHKVGKSHDKVGIKGYKPSVGQGRGVGYILTLRKNLLWSGHIAAET